MAFSLEIDRRDVPGFAPRVYRHAPQAAPKHVPAVPWAQILVVSLIIGASAFAAIDLVFSWLPLTLKGTTAAAVSGLAFLGSAFARASALIETTADREVNWDLPGDAADAYLAAQFGAYAKSAKHEFATWSYDATGEDFNETDQAEDQEASALGSKRTAPDTPLGERLSARKTGRAILVTAARLPAELPNSLP